MSSLLYIKKASVKAIYVYLYAVYQQNRVFIKRKKNVTELSIMAQTSSFM
jgi:hypothetical protein